MAIAYLIVRQDREYQAIALADVVDIRLPEPGSRTAGEARILRIQCPEGASAGGSLLVDQVLRVHDVEDSEWRPGGDLAGSWQWIWLDGQRVRRYRP